MARIEPPEELTNGPLLPANDVRVLVERRPPSFPAGAASASLLIDRG